ncbi:hypothetical protein [Streptomyces sp. 3211]|uniref:hypothetical protein n=1 Tax=Streptomyces sp. 3211 TaxID=1964449 RepID=UPI0009A4FD74|nr:hypothetical protein [Streptomyces sp. 3211]
MKNAGFLAASAVAVRPQAAARRWRAGGQPVGCGVPDDELADQALGQLLGGRDEVGEPVVHQGAAVGLEQRPATGSGAR